MTFVLFLALSILKMSFNRSKYEYFFPSKVFRCACLGADVVIMEITP